VTLIKRRKTGIHTFTIQ